MRAGDLNLQKILAIRDLFRHGRLTPIKLLDLARDFEVSNPRERIIGLIGLLPQEENSFRPDYSWSETELFHHFATYMIGNALQPRPWGSEDRKSLLPMPVSSGNQTGVPCPLGLLTGQHSLDMGLRPSVLFERGHVRPQRLLQVCQAKELTPSRDPRPVCL
jgi:hypothetical protein